MNKLLIHGRRLWRGGGIFIHLIVGLALGVLMILPALRWRLRDAAWRDAWALWWLRRMLKLLHVRLRVVGDTPPAPVLLVANHISWLDIVVLGSIVPASFVAKAEIQHWPAVNLLCRVAETRFIEPGSMESAQSNLADLAAALRGGRSVIVFPEGKASNGQQVRRFRRRLYQAALASATPAQAVALLYPAPQGCNPAVVYAGDTSLWQSFLAVLAQPEIAAEAHFLPLLRDLTPYQRERGDAALAEYTRRQVAGVVAAERTR